MPHDPNNPLDPNLPTPLPPKQEVVNTKPWWYSKMQWLNIGSAIVGVLTVILEIAGVIDFPYETEVITAVGSLIATINVILRAITKSPLTLQ